MYIPIRMPIVLNWIILNLDSIIIDGMSNIAKFGCFFFSFVIYKNFHGLGLGLFVLEKILILYCTISICVAQFSFPFLLYNFSFELCYFSYELFILYICIVGYNISRIQF